MVKNGDDGIPSEIDILLKMKHANIVEIEEVFESEDYFIYVMEKFGKGTDLFDFLQEQERLSEGEARYIFRQVLSAVAHLASQNVVHGDIKVFFLKKFLFYFILFYFILFYIFIFYLCFSSKNYYFVILTFFFLKKLSILG